MTPDLSNSNHLFVANLQSVSLEKLVKSKLEVLFEQQREAQVELNGLYKIFLEQVEKHLLVLIFQQIVYPRYKRLKASSTFFTYAGSLNLES